MESFNYSPIAFFKSYNKSRYEAPRQPVGDSSGLIGEIKLLDKYNFQQALTGLEGFERIWLIYEFNQNKNWKTMTRTPRATKKQGVFATRAPYRPNPIGISCVKLLSIEGRTLKVKEFDLLDGTPILDIKPYIKECDSFDVNNHSWVEEEQEHQVQFSLLSTSQLEWLDQAGEKMFELFIKDQLKYDPLNRIKKRVSLKSEGLYTLCYGTWRIDFEYQEEKRTSVIQKIYSGYSEQELLSSEDKYQNKETHRSFIKKFYSDDLKK